MHTKRLATEMGILNAPEEFLFLPLAVREGDQLRPPLKSHLVSTHLSSTSAYAVLTQLSQTEHLIVSHFHDPRDGYVYLEENDWLSDDELSVSSVIHTPKDFQKQKAKIDRTVCTPPFKTSTIHLTMAFAHRH